MKRFLPLLAVALALAALTAPAAVAGERKAVEATARQAASDYIEQFGVYYTPDMWKADCSRKRSSWKCEVVSQPPQCSGELRVQSRRSGGYRAYSERIGCAE